MLWSCCFHKFNGLYYFHNFRFAFFNRRVKCNRTNGEFSGGQQQIEGIFIFFCSKIEIEISHGAYLLTQKYHWDFGRKKCSICVRGRMQKRLWTFSYLNCPYCPFEIVNAKLNLTILLLTCFWRHFLQLKTRPYVFLVVF